MREVCPALLMETYLLEWRSLSPIKSLVDCSVFEARWGRGGSIIMVIHVLRGEFASGNLISVEFLHLFLRCHFAGKPLVVS